MIGTILRRALNAVVIVAFVSMAGAATGYPLWLDPPFVVLLGVFPLAAPPSSHRSGGLFEFARRFAAAVAVVQLPASVYHALLGAVTLACGVAGVVSQGMGLLAAGLIVAGTFLLTTASIGVIARGFSALGSAVQGLRRSRR